MTMTLYNIFNDFVLSMPDISLKEVANNLHYIETAYELRKAITRTIVITPHLDQISVSTEHYNLLVPGSTELNISIHKAKATYNTIKFLTGRLNGMPLGLERDALELDYKNHIREYWAEHANSAKIADSMWKQLREYGYIS